MPTYKAIDGAACVSPRRNAGHLVFVGRWSETPPLVCMAGLFDWALVVDRRNVGLFECRPTGRSTTLRSEAECVCFTPSERGALGFRRSVVGDPDVGLHGGRV